MTLMVRSALYEDCRLFYDWAMEPTSRRMSVRSDEFTYEQHCQWWDRRFNDQMTRMYVGLVDDVPVGQVRFGLDGERGAEVAISVDKDHRDRGYAKALLSEGERLVVPELHPNVFVALVLPRNYPSILLFEHSGYTVVATEKRLNKLLWRYHKPWATDPSTAVASGRPYKRPNEVAP